MSGRILYVPIRILRKPTVGAQPLTLPEGCEGLLVVYNSEEAARKSAGEDVPIARLLEQLRVLDGGGRLEDGLFTPVQGKDGVVDAADVKFDDVEGAEFEQLVLFCRRCQQLLPDDATACPRCAKEAS